MAIYRAVSGVNREIKTIHRNVSGVNREIATIHRNVSGTNRLVYNKSITIFNPAAHTIEDICDSRVAASYHINEVATSQYVSWSAAGHSADRPQYKYRTKVLHNISNYSKLYFDVYIDAVTTGSGDISDTDTIGASFGVSSATNDSFSAPVAVQNFLDLKYVTRTPSTMGGNKLRKTVEVDVASITGSHYIGFAGWCKWSNLTHELRIYNIYAT